MRYANCIVNFVEVGKEAAARQVRQEPGVPPLVRELIVQSIIDLEAEPNEPINVYCRAHQFTPTFGGDISINLSVKRHKPRS